MNAFDDLIAVLKSKTLEDRLNAVPELREMLGTMALLVNLFHPAITLSGLAFMVGAYLAAAEGLDCPIEKQGVLMTKDMRIELFMVEVEAAYQGYLANPPKSQPQVTGTRH